MTEPLNIIFAGTPDFAAQHLIKLINSKHHIIAVISQPDKVVGRGNKTQLTPVKKIALQHNIPVHQFNNLKDIENQQLIANYKPDIIVVVAFGLLIPQQILDIPKYGCINVHGSLLPRWRGAAPIQRAIEAGDKETGVCIMKMDKGLDTGQIYKITKTKISEQDTSLDLFARLAELGANSLLEVINNIKQQTLISQQKLTELYGLEVSYAHKLEKSEGLINFQQTSQAIQRKLNAFNPWPGVYFNALIAEQTIPIKIIQAHVVTNFYSDDIVSIVKNKIIIKCAQKTFLALDNLQIPGKKPMDSSSFINGYKKFIKQWTF